MIGVLEFFCWIVVVVEEIRLLWCIGCDVGNFVDFCLIGYWVGGVRGCCCGDDVDFIGED